MQRTLEPEILDSLAPDDPAALHNRRDLRLTNALMGNHRWLCEQLLKGVRPGEKILELGAGTGDLGSRFESCRASVLQTPLGWAPSNVRRLQDRRPTGPFTGPTAIDGLDLWPRPSHWPAGSAWHSADLLSFEGYGDYAVICGNLIFHQFSAEDLGRLGRRLKPRLRLLVANEPVRRRSSQILFGALAPLLGANAVSRHDGHVSIAAGFQGDELPRLLGLEPAQWRWRVTTTILGAYRCVAERHSWFPLS